MDPTLGNVCILIYRKYNKCRTLKIRTNYRKTSLESKTPFKTFLNKKTACELSQSFYMDITQSNVKKNHTFNDRKPS